MLLFVLVEPNLVWAKEAGVKSEPTPAAATGVLKLFIGRIDMGATGLLRLLLSGHICELLLLATEPNEALSKLASNSAVSTLLVDESAIMGMCGDGRKSVSLGSAFGWLAIAC